MKLVASAKKLGIIWDKLIKKHLTGGVLFDVTSGGKGEPGEDQDSSWLPHAGFQTAFTQTTFWRKGRGPGS